MDDAYYLLMDSAGAVIGSGYSPDGTLPSDAVACTAAQAATPLDYTVSNGAVVPQSDAWVLAAAQAAQIASIRAACQAAIVDGFTSSALGSAYTYPSTTTDQNNLFNAATVAAGQSTAWKTWMWCATGSPLEWDLIAHTATQVQQVNADFLAAREAVQKKYANLLAQIKSATTVAAVQALTW
jgi:hypothetical protein